MNNNRGVHIANGFASPKQQTKVYLGNKERVYQSVQNGATYKKTKYADGSCGCGSNRNPKQMKKTVK